MDDSTAYLGHIMDSLRSAAFDNNMSYFDILVVAFTITAIVIIRYNTSQANSLKLPPGPTPSFFVGNMYDIPAAEEWNTFTKWTKQFGKSFESCTII